MKRIPQGTALVLSFFVLVSTFCSQALAGKKIALDIYLADEIAYRSNHAYYMKDVFARLFPQIEYRQVLVPNSLIGLNKEKTRKQVIEQIKKEVAPDDTIEFLILDTHGNTVESDRQLHTTLNVLGQVGPDRVDANFDQVFSTIKSQAAPDLTVILNSCLTFFGPVEESQKRAQTFLNYFSAPNGSIYGAYVKEVDSLYLDPTGWKLKALVPSWKIYLTTMALFGAAFGSSPLLNGNLHSFEMLTAALHGALYFGLPFATLIETLNPLFSWIAGKTFANRGWLFKFQSGKLVDQMNLQKPRDLQLMLMKGSRSCESVHN